MIKPGLCIELEDTGGSSGDELRRKGIDRRWLRCIMRSSVNREYKKMAHHKYHRRKTSPMRPKKPPRTPPMIGAMMDFELLL